MPGGGLKEQLWAALSITAQGSAGRPVPSPPTICARRPRVPLSLKLTDTWAVAPFGLSRAKLMWTGVSESPPGLLLPSLGLASS